MRATRPVNYPIDAQDTRDRVMRFLSEIGVAAHYEPGARGFSEGCHIDRGTLAVDPACRVSTLLHEAGHLAITSRCFRSLMDGNLWVGQREMPELIDSAGLHPDEPLYRAVIQCSDPEATAWTWATAGTELGLPGEEIVRDDEYGGDGETIRLALQMRAYSVCMDGHAGFCAIRECNGVLAWPHFHFWTQDATFPESADVTAGGARS